MSTVSVPGRRFLLLVLLLFGFSRFGLGEDWTIKGKTYHNIHVIKVHPDTISVTFDGGVGRFYLSDLDPLLQSKFKDAAAEAKAFAVIEKNAATDPIAHLVVTLSASPGMWRNGASFLVRLPETASPEEVAANSLPRWGCGDYKILKLEKLQIDLSPRYTEILFHTPKGDKILVIAYQGEGEVNGVWWSRVYDSGF